jgi:hypothetical protein
MNSYKSRREARKSSGGSNYQSSRDIDKVSLIGSVRSDMSSSALEKKLADAQERIKQLQVISTQQQQTIDRLMSLISNKRP